MARNDAVKILQSTTSTHHHAEPADEKLQFLMTKLIRYCPQIRPLLIPALTSHLPTLLAHAHGVQPLSDFFDLHATSREKRLLVRGFYPREVMLFDGGKNGADVQSLEGTLEGIIDGKGRERILSGVEKTVVDM